MSAEPSGPRKEGFVELKNVFAVKVKRRRMVGQQSGGTLLGITLFHCKRKGSKLKDHETHLNNLSVDHCEIWFKQLKALLSGKFAYSTVTIVRGLLTTLLPKLCKGGWNVLEKDL